MWVNCCLQRDLVDFCRNRTFESLNNLQYLPVDGRMRIPQHVYSLRFKCSPLLQVSYSITASKAAERNFGFRNCPRYSSMYQSEERGSPYTLDYRIYFKNATGAISPLHDIPMLADPSKKIYNMVVEIPRWTNAKMEINLKEVLNPIKQDIKKGKLRFVSNCFPHHGYIWNYGAIPQTWENPEILDESTGCKGDNDPIDALEIGFRVAKRGEVLQVKVLGCVALIDEGETDWKIIVIDVNDPAAEQLKDITDVEKQFPGLLKATIEWFKIYKIPDGKPENQFAFNGEAKNKDFAHHILEDVHKYWQGLIKKEIEAGGISCANVTVEDSPFKIEQSEADEIITKSPPLGPAQEIDTSVDKWHFLHLK